MIIEIPNALGTDKVNEIKEAVYPFISKIAYDTAQYRDGKTVCISFIPELAHIDQYLNNFFTTLYRTVIKQRYYPQFPSADSGYEYHIYGPGEICNYHADGEVSGKDSNVKLRYASVVLHLNTVKNGGELIFPNQNKKVKTEAGKVVIFPPYGMFGHYTTPSEESREVIVTWFIYEGIKVART